MTSTVVEELAAAARAAAEQTGRSVVRIGHGWGRGCGVVIGTGLVATNAHNVHGGEVRVVFGEGREAMGTVAGVDVDGDLAVLRVDTGDAPAITWADRAASAGDVVFALARSAGGGIRVSFGLVSATERKFRGPRGRRITGSVEHTAPLPRGSSGGPVVDSEGRVVGISTNRLGDGFYLALPVTADLRSRLDNLAAGQSPATPRLGLGLAPGRIARDLRRSVGLPERDGLLVRVVQDGSPAGRAGVRQGDLLVEAGGQPLTSVDDLHAQLDQAAATGSLTLKVVRGVDELDVRVSFDEDGGSEEGSA